MATIVSRKRGDGSTAHMARIIVKRKGKVVFKEARRSTVSNLPTHGQRLVREN